MSVCQPMCVSPLSTINPTLLKSVFYEHLCTCISQCLLLQFCQQMETSGAELGGSLYGTPAPAHFSLSSCPLRLLRPPSLLFYICAHQAEITALASYGQAQEPGCRRWKPPFFKRQMSLDPAFDTGWMWKQARMKYSYKITRLAPVKQGTYGYAEILHECTDVFVSSAAIVVLYLEYYIHKTNALLQEAGGRVSNHIFSVGGGPCYFIEEMKLTKCFSPWKHH